MTQLEELERRVEVPDCPYVGLRDFTERHAEFFFGRDAERKRIIGNLRASRLTLLYAESGVGKSSLLRAGVVPRLRQQLDRGRRDTGSRNIPVVFSTWSRDPTNALIDAVADAIATIAGAEPELPRDSVANAIATASQLTDGSLLLIILDQFEELFLYHSGVSDERFADELARCINGTDLPAHFLISIREDMYAGVGELLTGRVTNVYGNCLQLDHLDRAAAQDAITEPIRRFNELRPAERPVDLQPGLADEVLRALDQVRHGEVDTDEPDAVLPDAHRRGDETGIETTYLQLVMKRLWDEEALLGSSVLRLETLERLGGAHTIIGTHLDEAMNALPEDQRDAAATVFRFLVTSTGTKIALTAGELAELSDLDEPVITAMLQRLSASDLHILRPVVLRDSPDPRYEIFHDALARPMLAWRTRYTRAKLDAALTDERRQREHAEQEAVAAAAREARERTRKRWALVGLGLAVVALLATTLAFAASQRNAARRKAAYADSIAAVGRIDRTYGNPNFGADAVALASLEAARLGGAFAARTEALAALQSNVAMPAIGYGHTRSGLALAFLSNSLLATGSADGTVRLWDRDARPLAELSTPTNAVVSGLAVGSHSGRQILAAARRENGQVDLWDVTDPEDMDETPTASISIPDYPNVNAVAFDPAGTTLAVGSDDTLMLWDVHDPSDSRSIATSDELGRIDSVAFDVDGTHLAVAGAHGVAVLPGPDFAHAVPAWSDNRSARAVTYSPTGTLAYSLNDAERPGIVLRDPTGDVRAIAANGLVNSLAFADDGAVLVSGGADGNVTTWDVSTAREFGPPRTGEFSPSQIWAVGVSPDNETIAGVGGSLYVKLWPLHTSESLARTVGSVTGHDVGQDDAADQPLEPKILDLAVGPDGQVAAALGSGGAMIWNSDDSRAGPMITIPMASAGEFTDAVAYAGDVLATASGGSIKTWQTGDKCPDWPTAVCLLRTTPATSSTIWVMAFDMTGRWLAVGDSGGDVTLWRLEDGQIAEQLASWTADETASASVADLVFSPTQDVLAVATHDGAVAVYDIHDPRAPKLVGRPFGHHRQPVAALAFSPDGTTLASGGLDQRTVLWSVDLAAPEPVQQQPGLPLFQSNSILDLAFSPDGTVLAAADGDGSVCLYEAASHQSIGHCLTEHAKVDDSRAAIRAVAFRPDGSAMLSAGDGNPVVEWDSVLWAIGDDSASRERLAAAVCRFARRNLTEEEWDQAFIDTRLEGKRNRTCAEQPLP